jgi:multiple sugar transport system ATP-binding protein
VSGNDAASGVSLRKVSKRFDGVVAVDDVSLEVAAGEFLVLVGPSGCGKTTLLRMIAGLEEPTDGEIWIGDRDVTSLQPKERDVAMVFQNYALYPHMSVEENLGFSLAFQSIEKPEIRRRVHGAATMLGLETLLRRRPVALSGGQRQRVAMGRAIVREPRAFLMDEPLSNLDAKLRVRMRTELARLHARLRTTTVYVTHDQVEAMTLGHRVAVMRDGVVQQVDTPRTLFARPANVFVAAFMGTPPMNLLEATVADGVATVGGVEFPLPSPASAEALEGRRVLVGIRPASFQLADDAAREATRIAVRVQVVEDLGTERHVAFELEGAVRAGDPDVPLRLTDADGAVLIAQLPGTEAAPADPGDLLHLAVPRRALHLFDATTGGAID